ncbi:MAG: Zn-dependent exopeptidase M28 [Candidatus Thorarchaeota archaeon]|nr:Zn-dependent exopeptidase M28 [Candidatus Thorarchaeota archaeon]
MKARHLYLVPIIAILIVPNTGVSLALVLNSDGGRMTPNTRSAVYASDLAEDIYDAVSLISYRDYIIKLTENGSRTAFSEVNSLAAQWIASELEVVSEGRIEVETLGGYNNIVGRLPGIRPEQGPAFAVGGHYDTVADAPGANDDGAGVAAALELARVMSQHVWPLDIYFCFWNAEEIGLLGSQQVVPLFVEEEIDFLAYFNVDMLLWENPYAAPDERVLMVYRTENALFHDAQYWADMTRVMNNNFDSPVIKPIPQTSFPYWYQSDHFSFVQEGYLGALFAFESGSSYDTAFHTSLDTWDNPNYNYDLATDAVASIGATMAFAMGRTPGQSTHTRYEKTIEAGATQEILFESSIETPIEVRGIWEGTADLSAELRNPMDQIVTENSVTGADDAGMSLISSSVEDLGLHTVAITNNGGITLTLEIVLSYSEDIEGNGVPDHEEDFFNRWDVDSDEDGISDADEIFMGLNRYDPDEDEDGIGDYEEVFVYGTDPKQADSDFDGMPDPYEIKYGFNPSNASDASADSDGDTLTNLFEYGVGTNPILPDSDFDNLDDYSELFVYFTNALSNDTDLDQMPDNFEVEYGLDPLVDDAGLDADGDGMTNLQEYLGGTNPQFSEAAYRTALLKGMVGVLTLIIIVACVLARRKA